MHFPRWVKLQHFGHAIVVSFPRKFIPVDENVLIASYNSNASEIMKSGGKRVSPDLQKTKSPRNFSTCGSLLRSGAHFLGDCVHIIRQL